MAKQKLFRLTEDDMKIVMEGAIKRILKEGSYDTQDMTTWEDLKEKVGAEAMLEFVWKYCSVDELRDLIQAMVREFGLDDLDDDYDDDF